jgi:hypothetical protein
MRNSKWVRLLAYVTGSVNQELLLPNEYLAAENRILRARLASRLRLTSPERATLAEIEKRLGRRAPKDVATGAKPDTVLAWYRRLVAQKFDGSKRRRYPGRPAVAPEVEALIVRMARENWGWGYDRIVGSLAKPGPSRFGSDGGKRPPPSWHCSGAQAEPSHNVEGLPGRSYGCVSGLRFLHGGSAQLARAVDLLRFTFCSSFTCTAVA